MIDFEEATHTYKVNGIIYPSTTQIMSAIGLVRPYTGDPWYGERGTAIHKACELHDAGTLDFDSLDPRIVGFVEAYAKFKRETDMEFEYIESRFHHPSYRFCGCIDRAVPLVDLKSTSSACELQLAGYQSLLLANGIAPGREGYFLHLRENGTYKLAPYRFNRRDTNIFLSATSLWWWRKEHNLLD
jgi:hypothetical protein